jgi:Tfp pilus assembly protein PilN
LLALSQHAEYGKPTISLVGNQRDSLASMASTLDEQLDVSVQPLDVTTQVLGQVPSQTTPSATAPPTLPLIGFAIDEAQGKPPLVDLLHPHRSPQSKLDIRTYALAAAAGTLFVAAIFWAGYAKLRAPLNQAAKDQAALTLLEESLDELETYEQQAATIRDWNAETPNLLVHLQKLSKSIRPKSLEDESFAVDQDVVLEKLSFDKRKLTLEALARNNRAVHPLETRLRASAYRPERNQSDPSEKIKEYPWYMKSTIEITTASDSLELASQDQSTIDPAESDPAASDNDSNGASNEASSEEPSS